METTTNKGKPALLVDGFLLRLHRVSNTGKTWRCTMRGCPGRCRTNLNNGEINVTTEHIDHPAKTEREVAVSEFRKNCRKRGAEDPHDRPAKVMKMELESSEASQHINMADMEATRKAIYHQRRKTIPKLPKSREETQESVGTFTLESIEGENMIMKNDVDSGLIIFSTLTNLQLLCRGDVHILGDGTFKTCPRFYCQVYILHVYRRGVYVPCVFCLLPAKTELVYRSMFTHIKNIAAENDLDLDLHTIHLDFEKAAHTAVKSVWPQTGIKGCQFHLSQAWFRKIQSLGLTNEYKQADSEIGLWLKRFFGLSFLNPQDVQDSIAFDVMDDAPDDPRCTAFSDYILRTYTMDDATFPPVIWADSDVDSVRTTNACEAFHRHFADQFYHAHPSIFNFMDKLKAVQSTTYIKMNCFRTGRGFPTVRAQRRQKLAELQRLRTSYENGEITRKDFLRSVAWKNLPVVPT